MSISAVMRFEKWEGLGNDFILLDVPTDPDAQPRKTRTEDLDERLEPVVAAARARGAHAQRAQRKCQLIVEDDQVLCTEFQLLQQRQDRNAAQVHKSLRLR